MDRTIIETDTETIEIIENYPTEIKILSEMSNIFDSEVGDS